MTDLCYWLIIPIITRFLRIGMLIAVAAIVLGITSGDGLVAFYEHGHGPLATLPLVAQGVIFLIGQDFIMYWTHRWFHGETMWKYHAVHHSSEELEWISAARFHPINLFLGSVVADVTMLFAGISPTIFVVLGPLTVAHSAFVHANLHWTLGPFKYVFAGPVFPSLASHRRPTAAAKRISPRTFSLSRRHVRHVLHAGRPTSGPLRHRRARLPADLRRAARPSVQAGATAARGCQGLQYG